MLILQEVLGLKCTLKRVITALDTEIVPEGHEKAIESQIEHQELRDVDVGKSIAQE